MASRRPEDLHPWLRTRWEIAVSIWMTLHPKGPYPFLTSTYRSPKEQNDLYAQGRTKKGPKVTNARAGQSLHNYLPSYAFDIAFKDSDGKVLWDAVHFNAFAKIMKDLGVAWGGDWKGMKDRPHFDFPNFTWRDAQAGKKPAEPALPEKFQKK